MQCENGCYVIKESKRGTVKNDHMLKIRDLVGERPAI